MVEDNREKIVIERQNGKLAILILQPFDAEIELDEILKIDYGNIMGELLTFPVIFNRVANLKAEMDNMVSHAKLDTDIFESELRKEYRKKFLAASQKFTIDSLEDEIKTDTRYRAKKQHYINLQKDAAYLDGLYWAAQSKDSKLNRMSEKIRPEEFEKDLLEEAVNGVMIKMAKKVI